MIPFKVRETCPRCGGHGEEDHFLGAALRAFREEHGLGLREMSRKIGLSPSYLSDLEHDRRAVSAEIVLLYHDGAGQPRPASL